ncbi:cyclin-dependent protein kinase-activating kinase CAK1 Ecym_1502 [Eremothecium cymbalariae DBVPG|uniref:Protein kinase domain-containing protein n=1 Tax=Eremothecium cymbalariae (strain CBS 270.75 / DBVPG 7215 / KCTC 17166 / NRRL Y-17582) TaxID=931890 RepID=G8JMR1_ERECY|nr:hypothetical protein Ecym_1502 [Eremothecium cymbalariae DBVPG\
MTDLNTPKIICTTRYARIQLLEDKSVAKSVKIESQCAPHDVETELRILESCHHPHIIPVLSSKLEQGILEIRMPHIELDLYQFMKSHYRTKQQRAYLDSLLSLSEGALALGGVKIRKNHLSIERTLKIITQIADAIAYIHDLGIIHRDIKPQNVLINPNTDHIYLIDFGIAYDTTPTAHHKYSETDNNKIHDVSTSIYKAPELMFSVRNYSLPVDIWSFAVLISQLFQDQIETKSASIPAFVDDGSEELDAGTDIRAIMSVFHHLGIPSQQQWPQVVKYGSGGFVGIFGTQGDGNYIFEKPWQDQLARVELMFPRLKEVPQYQQLAKLLLHMLLFDTEKRITANETFKTLQSLLPHQ